MRNKVFLVEYYLELRKREGVEIREEDKISHGIEQNTLKSNYLETKTTQTRYLLAVVNEE